MSYHTQEIFVLCIACGIFGFIVGASFGDILHWRERRKLLRKYRAAVKREQNTRLRVLR